MVIRRRSVRVRASRPREGTVALGIRGFRVPLHSHVSLLWNGEEEFAEAAGFLEEGLRGEDHCLLAGSRQGRSRILGLLRERALDVGALTAAGRLTVLAGAPSPRPLPGAIAAAFRIAAAAGAPLIRFLGVPGWGERARPGAASLLALEARLSLLARRHPCVALCLYDVRSLPTGILEEGVFRRHGPVICGGRLLEEAQPVPPAVFVSSMTRAVRRVAARKHAGEALAESEARFARVFHASPVALGMSTITEGRIIDVNQSWLEMFGYRRDEVIGRTNRELNITVDPKDRPAVVRRVREHGTVRNVEIQVRRKSGEVLDLTVSAVAVDLGGKDESWLASHVDLTDRKRAEAERDRLLESATLARGQAEAALDRLRAIQSITDSAVFHLNLDAMLQELLARLRRALEADFVMVLLLDEESQMLYPRVVDGRVHERMASMRIPLGKGVSGRVAQTGQPVIIDDLSKVDFLSGLEGVPPGDMLALVRSSMAAPLQIEGKAIGVVAVGSARPRRFTREELDLLLLVADRAAPAVERGRLMETVNIAHERLEALSRRLVQVQEAERAQIARELHDEVGQLLTGLRLMVEARASDSEGAGDEVRAVVNEVIARVRDLSVSLRPPMLDALGLLPALLWQIERFEAQSRIQVVFQHANLDRRFSPEIETAAFRIVQEALTNVARHAAVPRVEVEVAAEATRLRAQIEDRGRGFDVGAALAGPTSGLAGMRERARLLEGRVAIESAAGSGTRLCLVLPLPDARARRPGR
jgi:PAS domain S-box-containing protein